MPSNYHGPQHSPDSSNHHPTSHPSPVGPHPTPPLTPTRCPDLTGAFVPASALSVGRSPALGEKGPHCPG